MFFLLLIVFSVAIFRQRNLCLKPKTDHADASAGNRRSP